MPSYAGELLALVKWVGGVDNKKYTTGINVAHIKNFNEKKFLDGEEDPEKVYVVEWHDGPEPLGGWICYNAKVIAISKKISVLEKNFKVLYGMRSPKRVDPKLFDNGVALKAKEPPKLEEKSEAYGESSSSMLKKLRKSNAESTDDGKNIKRTTELHDSEIEIYEEIISLVDDPDTADAKKILPDNVCSILSSIKDGNSRLDARVKVNLVAVARTSFLDSLFSQSKSSLHKFNMKELGLPGSGVFTPEAQYNIADRAQSATTMATSLLMSVFPRSVIANNNLRGGKSKTKNSTVQHSALDSDKLKAIHDTVEKRFKRRYNKSEVNRAINVKCSRVRSEKKEAKAVEGAKKPKLDEKSDIEP